MNKSTLTQTSTVLRCLWLRRCRCLDKGTRSDSIMHLHGLLAKSATNPFVEERAEHGHVSIQRPLSGSSYVMASNSKVNAVHPSIRGVHSKAFAVLIPKHLRHCTPAIQRNCSRNLVGMRTCPLMMSFRRRNHAVSNNAVKPSSARWATIIKHRHTSKSHRGF
jgi:hypothetical protein